MPEMPRYMVRQARRNMDEHAIAQVRRRVFIEEQGVPVALEWEALDAEGIWLLAESEGGVVVGIVHLARNAHLYRMAVLAPWRGLGVGAALLTAALAEARHLGFHEVRLSAQTHAVPFYTRHGFQPEGDIYMDAGIPHRAMAITFEDSP
jgi:predicted GNAT family N-acyltransferase